MDMAEITAGMTTEEQAKALLRVAIKDAGHLKSWLEKSGRKWLVFNSVDLVDALPFPDGVDTLIQLIACYRDYRSVQVSGRTETVKEPVLGHVVDMPVYKGEKLEVEELDRAIRYLIRQVTDIDPNWSVNNEPL